MRAHLIAVAGATTPPAACSDRRRKAESSPPPPWRHRPGRIAAATAEIKKHWIDFVLGTTASAWKSAQARPVAAQVVSPRER